ncbi:hypothetical protein BT96DRAFT_944627 [Gymnopus androsaceus JB14]|uniref:NB-ARC domain-containing protein n=1 Tax=Gymnopus androsaceus JB14 TaxID=1447944 RepID=A0A6A4H449_9AGAR|nr:hypothetical protein BT96DRAFT_944627 [Gymnopus androsaceus JB14]
MDKKYSRTTRREADQQFSVATGLKATTSLALPAATLRSITDILGPSTRRFPTKSKSRIEDFTSTTSQILSIVAEISEALENVPYLQFAAGLGVQSIKIIKEINECKEEWEKARTALTKMESMMAQFQSHRKALELSPIVQKAFQQVEACLQQVQEALTVYLDVNKMRKILQRNALKSEAVSCIASINSIHQYLQTNMIFGIWEATITSKQPDQVVKPLNMLKCPSPAPHFVGREDTLRKLSKIFAPPVVTISGPNQNTLEEFIKQLHRKYFTVEHNPTQPRQSPIFLDATSSETLAKSLADRITQSTSADTLLILKNAEVSVVDEQFHRFPCTPVLVTSTHSAISALASSTAWAFQLPDHADQQVTNKLLSSAKEALFPGQHVVTLVANGGTGKTQAVLKFSNIWFFDATSNTTLEANFKELGNAAGVGEDIKNARDFLARMNQNWLCIFDNADDPEVFLKKYIPSCNHGNVIVTSRLTETSQMASPGCHIDFSDLDNETAGELLLKQAHQDSSEENLDLASQIVDALGCHALAVSTAGAYIGTTPTCTLGNYLEHFHKKKTKILN